jgi:outer membrane protein assembly factor BamB
LDAGAPIWADAAFRNGRVFIGADDGRLHAVDIRTGREVWSFKAGGAIRARVTFVEDDIVMPADDGVLYRLNAQSGAERWRVRLAENPIRRLPISDPNGSYENRAPAVAVEGSRL